MIETKSNKLAAESNRRFRNFRISAAISCLTMGAAVYMLFGNAGAGALVAASMQVGFTAIAHLMNSGLCELANLLVRIMKSE